MNRFSLPFFLVLSLHVMSKGAGPDRYLCLTSIMGFGQKTTALWCAADSCFMMRFASKDPFPGRVGYYGMPVEAPLRARGDSLAWRAIRRKLPKVNPGSPLLTVVLSDSLKGTLSRTAIDQPGLKELAEWERANEAALTGSPVWSDSLTLSRPKPRSNVIIIRLASKAPASGWMDKIGNLRILTSTGEVLKTGVDGSAVETQVTLSDTCVAQVVSGKECRYKVPRGARSVQAILKISTPPGSTAPSKIPHPCLEGRFELVTEWFSWN